AAAFQAEDVGSIPITRSIPFQSPRGCLCCAGQQRHERNRMSRNAMQRLSFYLLIGLTLYASLGGAG
ncbi:MAG: hypothetical protein Q4G49_16265, partial [Paracoccus sp. (in: a-proteobacteria)]|nr:hypothetical protein [Paracoccus sp. (in: a-proteobacteria)]